MGPIRIWTRRRWGYMMMSQPCTVHPWSRLLQLKPHLPAITGACTRVIDTVHMNFGDAARLVDGLRE